MARIGSPGTAHSTCWSAGEEGESWLTILGPQQLVTTCFWDRREGWSWNADQEETSEGKLKRREQGEVSQREQLGDVGEGGADGRGEGSGQPGGLGCHPDQREH